MRLLIISHGWPPAAQGGAELYAASLAHALRKTGAVVAALAREADPGRPDAAVRDGQVDGLDVRWVNNTFQSARGFGETYANPAIARAALELVEAFRPGVAPVHHLTCLSTTLVRELRRRRVPVVYTLHDYWLMCHRGQLLDVSQTRCAGPRPTACQRCIGGAAAPAGAYAAAALLRGIEHRLPAVGGVARRAASVGTWWLHPRDVVEADARAAHMREVVAQVSWFLAPSWHMRRRMVDLGLPEDRVSLSEYGTDLTRFRADGPGRPAPARRLRLGFLGSLMVSKAPHVLIDAFGRLPPGLASVDLFGRPTPYHGDISYQREIGDRLARMAGAEVRLHDALPHERVPDALHALDVLVVPSVWEENSPLVIREALACGVPVVASRIGGIPETVQDGVNGLLFAPGDASDLTRVLRRLLDEPALLPRLRAGIRPPRSLEEDAKATGDLYESLIATERGGVTASPPANGRRGAAVVLNYRTPDRTRLAVRALAASTFPVDIIVVDNDGPREGADLPAIAEPGVTLLQTGGNLGFAGGCNVGIGHALATGAPWIVLVNSDLLVAPDTIEGLARAADEHPEAGILGPLLLSSGEPTEVSSAGMDYVPRSGRMQHRAAGLPRAGAHGPKWQQVAGVSGCAMLVRREVFERAGLLPEEYFFSFEDLAFCLRARRAGFDVGLTTQVAAYHEGSGTMGRSPDRFYYAARNHLRLAAEHQAGGLFTRVARSAFIVALNLAHACRPDPAPAPARLLAVGRGLKHYLTGRTGRLT